MPKKSKPVQSTDPLGFFGVISNATAKGKFAVITMSHSGMAVTVAKKTYSIPCCGKTEGIGTVTIPMAAIQGAMGNLEPLVRDGWELTARMAPGASVSEYAIRGDFYLGSVYLMLSPTLWDTVGAKMAQVGAQLMSDGGSRYGTPLYYYCNESRDKYKKNQYHHLPSVTLAAGALSYTLIGAKDGDNVTTGEKKTVRCEVLSKSADLFAERIDPIPSQKTDRIYPKPDLIQSPSVSPPLPYPTDLNSQIETLLGKSDLLITAIVNRNGRSWLQTHDGFIMPFYTTGKGLGRAIVDAKLLRKILINMIKAWPNDDIYVEITECAAIFRCGGSEYALASLDHGSPMTDGQRRELKEIILPQYSEPPKLKPTYPSYVPKNAVAYHQKTGDWPKWFRPSKNQRPELIRAGLWK